jgi:hypothetical protein
MTVLHMDGFDGYATNAQLAMRYPLNNVAIISTTGGRFSGGCLNGASSAYLEKPISGNPSTLIVGFALFYSSAGSSNTIDIRNAAGSQCVLYFNATSAVLEARRGATVLGTSAVLVPSTWHHIELKVTIHGSTGTFELRVNEVVQFALTGQNTQGQVSGGITGVRLGGSSANYDDWYILDTTGATAADFLGDTRITTIRPTADSSVQFTRSAGATNFSCVDDTTVDAVDYVSSSTVGHRDVYDLTDLTGTPAVYAVMPTAWALKTDAGTRGIKVGIKTSGGTEVQTADTALTTTTNPYSLAVQNTTPAAAAWTYTAVNAIQLTLELSS